MHTLPGNYSTMKDDDLVTIREESEVDPAVLYRRSVLEKVASAVFLTMKDDEVLVTADNITFLLSLLNIKTSDDAIIDLVRDACIRSGGVINTDQFGEIVLRTVLPSEEVEEDTLKEAFSLVDVDGDNIITGADIYRLMMGIGKVITDDEIRQMLGAVDHDDDGRASFQDFRCFMLGREPPSTPEPETTSTECSQDSNRTEDSQLHPKPVVHVQAPEHKKRRRLFSYGDMIAKQLAVISNMKKIMEDAKMEGFEGSTVDTESGKNQETEKNMMAADENPDIHKEYTLKDNGTAAVEEATDDTANTNTTQPPQVDDIQSDAWISDTEKTNTGCNEQPCPAYVPDGKICSQYSKKSPYYGRVRPVDFKLNPLPPLPPEAEDSGKRLHSDTVSSTDVESDSSSTKSSGDKTVFMVDSAQQTTEDFDDIMAEYGQTISVVIKPRDAVVIHQVDGEDNAKRRDSSTLTEIHGLAKRIKRAQRLEKAILKRRNTSFEIFKCPSDETEPHKFPGKLLLRRSDSKIRLSAGIESPRVTDRVRQFSSTENKITFSHCEPGIVKTTSKRPQTAKPCRTRDIFTLPQSIDFKCDRSVSDNLDENNGVKRVNVVELTENINRESVYTPDIMKSQRHHGFRSIRPLARVIMAIQSTARAANKSLTRASSFSRLLEETGTPYVRPDSAPEEKHVHAKPCGKSNLLNIELPVEKISRPVLKRRSALSRIIVDEEMRSNWSVLMR